MTAVTLPETLETLGASAFANSRYLRSVYIGDKLTAIGSEAFYGCNSLSSASFGTSVVRIEDDAFYDCSTLYEITYRGGEADWKKIEIIGADTLFFAVPVFEK